MAIFSWPTFTVPTVTVPTITLPSFTFLQTLQNPIPTVPTVTLPSIGGGWLDVFRPNIPSISTLDLDRFRTLDTEDIDDLVVLAATLPLPWSRPDSTGEVRTGSATIGREEAATAASIAAAPRIVDALGPDATTVELRGHVYDIVERYESDVTGFSALHLHDRNGGLEVFAIDGLQVGSRADQVASATLGRLVVESAEFRDMVGDADAYAVATGRPVLVTGASLGGAIAEVAAYEIAEGLTAVAGKRFATGAVHLVTVDALGGRDAAEDINGGRLDPRALNLINALNLRDDGDLVSRIGSHIGGTITFPTLDATGQRVQLDPEEAHVNVVSLFQVLNSDALFAQGVRGAPAEISGFAAASNALSDELISAYLKSEETDPDAPHKLEVPGNKGFDATRTLYSVDADANGTVDIAVRLSQPAPSSVDPFVL